MSRRPRPRFRGVCAICDNTNETTQICRKCRRDPVNAGWVESWEDSDEGIEARAAGSGLSSVGDKRLRDASALKRQILDLFTRGIYEPIAYLDKRGHRRGTRMRYRRISFREIARRVGCSKTYVVMVIREQLAG